MEWTLEVIMVPVSDVDRAKEFYTDRCGFHCDIDVSPFEGARFVQLTPPGSRCSIVLEAGLPTPPGRRRTAPGSLQDLQLCVTDIEAARDELADRGLDVGPVRHVGPNGWEEGRGTEIWNSFLFFEDPDGNGWVVQEAPSPLAER
ncbi:VOC family protein [Streptomyces sp. NPDC093250]|uniref:VOC family protein n=1 Tax=Streptomyces sp. NPDC093250 TaxID=3366036 RepID=UPI003806A908